MIIMILMVTMLSMVIMAIFLSYFEVDCDDRAAQHGHNLKLIKGKRFKCTDPHTNVPPGRHPADVRVCKGEFTPGGTLVQGCRTPSASSGEHRSEGLRE